MRQPNRKLGARRTKAIAILLLCGLIASVLVAWSIEVVRAYRAPPFPENWTFLSTQGRIVDPRDASRALIMHSERSFGSQSVTLCQGGAFALLLEETHRRPPAWVVLPPPDEDIGTGAAAYGYPFLCMKYDEVTTLSEKQGYSPNGVPTSAPQYETRVSHALPWYDYHHSLFASLPTKPILPGLLLNTLFYATLFSTPYLLRQSRRHLRLRRGHCPFCNYDLRGQPTLCPECGRGSTTPA